MFVQYMFFSDADPGATSDAAPLRIPDIYCSVDRLYLLPTECSLLNRHNWFKMTNISAYKVEQILMFVQYILFSDTDSRATFDTIT